MSSTNKTSLGLNIWEASDKPVRQDFINDNVIIDEKISELNSNLRNKQDSLNLPSNTIIDYSDSNLAKTGGWVLADGTAMYYNFKMGWGIIQFKMKGNEIYIRPQWGLSTPGDWKKIY